MKIFSNFDTRLYSRMHREYDEKYGEEHVVVVKRSRMYFLVYVLVPLILLLSTYGISGFLMFSVLPQIADELLSNLAGIMILILLLGVTVRFGLGIIAKLIDYAMDFCIITPYEIVYYNQDGILNRKTEIIDTEKIKTITKESSGFIKSFLNYGDIVFLSEGDSEIGDIALDWVEDPEIMYQKVRTIIEPHMNAELREKISKAKQAKEHA